MAIKKVVKMSAAPAKKVVTKKVVVKKADPGKGVVAKAKDTMMSMGKVKYTGKPMSDAKKAAYYGTEMRKANSDFDKATKYTKNMSQEQVNFIDKTNKRGMQMSDSTKKYTQKSLDQIKNLNRKK
jgi:hypothetical protein